MSLLGEDIISSSDWFRGKNRHPDMGSLAIFGGIFCVLPLEISIADTEIMAAVKIKSKRSKMSSFEKFMADFRRKKATEVCPEDTCMKVSLRQ